MPESTFDDLPILAELGAALDDAMARELVETTRVTSAPEAAAAHSAAGGRGRRRFTNPFRTFTIALLFVGLGTSTAAATLTVLRGSPIPVPKRIDTQPLMRPTVDSGKVLGLRAANPGGGDPFALRTSRSETGLTCVTVGQSQGDRFGVVGTDDQFRDLPTAIVDGCGLAGDGAPVVMGARVFDDPEREDVRTVVYGLGSPDLERATVEVRGTSQPLPLTDHAFLLALPDYPEDSGLRVKLDYADGTSSTHPLGISPTTIVDPTGPAWRVSAGSMAGWDGLCIAVSAARTGPRTPDGPQLCGRTRSARDSRPAEAYFFGARTLHPGDRDSQQGIPLGNWSWRDGPPRTMVYGYVDPKKVRAVRVFGGAAPVVARIISNGDFLAVLPATVAASATKVELSFTNGEKRTFQGDTNVVQPTRRRSR